MIWPGTFIQERATESKNNLMLEFEFIKVFFFFFFLEAITACHSKRESLHFDNGDSFWSLQ